MLGITQRIRKRRDRNQRLSLVIRNDLRIDMLTAAKHAHTRPLVGTDDFFAHPRSAAQSRAVYPFTRHRKSSTPYFPPAEPTALPALRLITSSRYLMPLPL